MPVLDSAFNQLMLWHVFVGLLLRLFRSEIESEKTGLRCSRLISPVCRYGRRAAPSSKLHVKRSKKRSTMVASDVAAFSLPASGGTAAAAAAAAAAALLPGGIVLGALSERLALRSSPLPLLPLTPNSQPTRQRAWGAAVRATAGAAAVRGLYLWSGMSAVDASISAAALGRASSTAGATIKLNADAMAAMLTFVLWTVCLASGAKIGSILQPVGITGGIACGKSTVSELLAANAKDDEQKTKEVDATGTNKKKKTPFAIIDVDKIGHDILIPGKLIPSESAYANVVREFGTEILSADEPTPDAVRSDGGDGTSRRIERRQLGDVIFRDPSRRRTLNRLTHPLISKIMLKRVVTWNLFRTASDTANKMVAVDIPLLFEVGTMMKILFGLKVVVACKPSTQLKRLMSRNADLTEEQCQNRVDSQMPVADKVNMADVVIWNDGDMDALEAEVEKARADICARVGGWGVSVSKVVLLLGASMIAKTVATASGLS